MNSSHFCVQFVLTDSLTTTLMPLKPFPMPPPSCEPSFEIAEFSANSDRDMYPYTTFVNHLFIYPQSLSFDSQKLFSRARNIALTIEVRDSDADDAKAIPVKLRTAIPLILHFNRMLFK